MRSHLRALRPLVLVGLQKSEATSESHLEVDESRRHLSGEAYQHEMVDGRPL